MNKLDFSGRRAVVTGGASGIGLAVCRRLQQGGARVSVWDVDAAALAKAKASLVAEADTRAIDVTRWEAVAEAAAATVQALGGIDILVCSAGISGPNHTTWDYPLDQWRRVFAINVDGVFHCCRAVVPVMVKNGYGRIVNVASIAGKEGNPNAPAYSASKAAVIGLTKSLGKELARTRITVNC